MMSDARNGQDSLRFTVATSGLARVSRPAIEGSFTIGISDGAVMARLITMAPGHALQASTATRRPDAARDDLVINLATGGGILHLPRESLRGLVFVNGVPIPMGFLPQWALINGQPPPLDQDLVIPQMPAGEYILCNLTADEKAMVIAGVAVPTRDVCAEGFLSPGGTLELSAPTR